MKKRIIPVVIIVVALGLIATGFYWDKISVSRSEIKVSSPSGEGSKSFTFSPKEETFIEIYAHYNYWGEAYPPSDYDGSSEVYDKKLESLPSVYGYSLEEVFDYIDQLCDEDINKYRELGGTQELSL